MQISPALANNHAFGRDTTATFLAKKAAMSKTTSAFTMRERFDLTLKLWPYMIPLAVIFR